MKRLVLVAAALLALTAPAVAADKTPNILEIFDRFVVTSAAGGKCLTPPPETLGKFLGNFQIVTNAARGHLHELRPNWEPAKIDEVMKKRVDQLTEKTHGLIAKQGCEGKEVAALLRYFDIHAKWEPAK